MAIEDDETGFVSTGRLPDPDTVTRLIDAAHETYRHDTGGRTSQVYPALAAVREDLFGICLVGTSGRVYAVGDCDHPFTIMSVSKPFVFALVAEALGIDACEDGGRQQHRPAVRLARRRSSGAATGAPTRW